jgi:hypothetical protein
VEMELQKVTNSGKRLSPGKQERDDEVLDTIILSGTRRQAAKQRYGPQIPAFPSLKTTRHEGDVKPGATGNSGTLSDLSGPGRPDGQTAKSAKIGSIIYGVSADQKALLSGLAPGPTRITRARDRNASLPVRSFVPMQTESIKGLEEKQLMDVKV